MNIFSFSMPLTTIITTMNWDINVPTVRGQPVILKKKKKEKKAEQETSSKVLNIMSRLRVSREEAIEILKQTDRRESPELPDQAQRT